MKPPTWRCSTKIKLHIRRMISQFPLPGPGGRGRVFSKAHCLFWVIRFLFWYAQRGGHEMNLDIVSLSTWGIVPDSLGSEDLPPSLAYNVFTIEKGLIAIIETKLQNNHFWIKQKSYILWLNSKLSTGELLFASRADAPIKRFLNHFLFNEPIMQIPLQYPIYAQILLHLICVISWYTFITLRLLDSPPFRLLLPLLVHEVENIPPDRY